MIRTLIIDDEEDAREALRLSIEMYCTNIDLLDTCNSAEEGLKAIHEHQPDLVFLDIQMPRLTGFDLLQRVASIPFEVFFVTAHDQYAIKAIRFSALDYLLKPVDVDDLMQAVRRVEQRLQKANSIFQYQSLVHNAQLKPGQINRLAVPASDGIEFLDPNEIVYCQADGNYTTLHLTHRKKKLISKNLKDFEYLLAESGFCRVHHSSLINLKHIQKYIKGEGGCVILTDNHHVDISRRKKEVFLHQLSHFQLSR
ncbi:MAG: LytR/AlgR family response regulator transcription factor [Cyclobacteriaceae bacterium]